MVSFVLIKADINFTLKQIKIFNEIINIDINEKKIYEITLNNVVNVFIIEDALFKFTQNEITHQITIYKNINNHFLIEGIFSKSNSTFNFAIII